MWAALGSCYEKLGKKAEAVKCQERSTRSKDREGISLFKMAALHKSLGDRERAAQCYRMILDRASRNFNNWLDQNQVQVANLFLGQYYKDMGNGAKAMEHLKAFHQTSTSQVEREKAGELMRQIHQL